MQRGRVGWTVVAVVGTLGGTSPATAAPTAPAWTLETIDHDIALGTGVAIDAHGPSPQILATPSGPRAIVAYTRGDRGWTVRSVADNASLSAATFDDAGQPWTLAGSDVTLIHGKTVESLGASNSLYWARSIVLGPDGTPHACFTSGNSDQIKDMTYATRAGTRARSRWRLETLPFVGYRCTIAATADHVYIALDDTRAGVRVLSRAGTAPWAAETLGADGSSAIARDAHGNVVIALASQDRVEILRRTGDAWTHTTLVEHAGKELFRIWLAIDRDDHAHVVYRHEGDLAYVREGGASTMIAHAAPEDLALAVDPAGTPHIAFFTPTGDDLVYGRPQAGPTLDPTADVIGACARGIAHELGAPGLDPVATARDGRLCAEVRAHPIGDAELARRCDASNADACLLGAIQRSKAVGTGIVTTELHHDGCTKPIIKKCISVFWTRSELGMVPARGRDDAGAKLMLARACELGMKPACLQQATVARIAGETSAEPFLRACSPELPIACAIALEMLDPGTTPASALVQMRATLATACAHHDGPEACNALAYMEDAGLGGRRQSSRAHHVRACEHHAVLSCAHVLTGPVHLSLSGDELDHLLTERCEQPNEDGCLALATSLDHGWGMPRDRKRARELLEVVCEQNMPLACKRAGKPLPQPH